MFSVKMKHPVDDLHAHFFCSCSRCPSLEAFSLQIPMETVTGWIEEAALAMEASEGAAAALAAETAPPAGAQSAAADAAATEAAAEEAPSDTSGNTGRVAEAENRMVQPAASSASPAVPAVQGQAQTLVSSMVESAKKQEREVAEALVASMGKECQLDTTLVLLSQDEIQKYTVSLPQAPEIFRRRYNTSTNYSWALSGFNPIKASFFPTGFKTAESAFNICAGYLFAFGNCHCCVQSLRFVNESGE